jgi:hypothetical protein
MSLELASNQWVESQLDELEKRFLSVNRVYFEAVDKFAQNADSLKETLQHMSILNKAEQQLNVQRELTIQITNQKRDEFLEKVEAREIFEKKKSVLILNFKSNQNIRIPCPIRLVRLHDFSVYKKLKYLHLFDPDSRANSNQIELRDFDNPRKYLAFLLNSDRLLVQSKLDNFLYVYDYRAEMVVYEKSISSKYRILSLRCFNNRIVCLKQFVSNSNETTLSIYDEYSNLIREKRFENDLVHSLPCISSKLIGYWSVNNKRYEFLNYDLQLVDCFGMMEWQMKHLNDGPLIHVNDEFFFIQNLNKSLQIKCISRRDLTLVRSIPIDSSLSFLIQIDSESRLFVKYNHSNADSSSLVCIDARTGDILFERSLLTSYVNFYLCNDHLAYSNLRLSMPNIFTCFPYI